MKLHHSHWTIVWIFHVKPAKQRIFRRIYGLRGDWARLFAKDQNYMGTELLRHSTNTRCYLTVDRWASRAAYHNFKKQHRKEFVALDARCKALTVREIKIGEFSSTGSPPKTPKMRKVRSPSGFAGPKSG
jgi:heme-degrading monooxygenase HmoA